MEQKTDFGRQAWRLAVPVALQSLLQTSFGMVDQVMLGRLGSVSVAAVGLAGKFSSIFSVSVSAVGTVAGIMMAQYLGRRAMGAFRRSFSVNLLLALALAGIFTALSAGAPKAVMGLYIRDQATVSEAAGYLRLTAGAFVPMAGTVLLSALYRCAERAGLPLYASLAAAALNTGLNFLLIFGGAGLPAMGARGAALATLISQWAAFGIMLLLLPLCRKALAPGERGYASGFRWKEYGAILLPVLACELLWSLGENVYAGIYGFLGRESSAAMTLINPVQGLMTGTLCGLSAAAGVLVGKSLGRGREEEAYQMSKCFLRWGLVGALVLSGVIVLLRGAYVEIYRVEPQVKLLTSRILLAYAAVAPCKVLNMILSGSILRSGGRTRSVMFIDLIGTWGFGVPLALAGARLLGLPVYGVYLLLSMEEAVRLALSLHVFRGRSWMRQFGE